jgi:hypothetical protein
VNRRAAVPPRRFHLYSFIKKQTMNNKSNEKSSMVLKAAFAMLAAGLPMQYASANGNVAPNALTQTQGAVVQGTVKDGTGEPLIGVSVVVKGATGLGVVTDIDGNYKINVKDKNAVLVFSYIGYIIQMSIQNFLGQRQRAFQYSPYVFYLSFISSVESF